MKNKKVIIGIIILLSIIGGVIIVQNLFNVRTHEPTNPRTHELKYWTCAMHPSVRVTDEEYKRGKKNCPICGMDLIPVYEEKAAPKEEFTKEGEAYYGCGLKEEGHCPHCDEGKPDEKCICGEHTYVLKGKEINCPVCGRALKKLTPEEIQSIDKSVVSRVSLRRQQVELAGLVIEPVQKYHLSKTIRTVGRIAFDPELAVAQEEFLTALETRSKVSKSPDVDVINRAEDIVNKSKLRLRLLGLSDDEIKELEEARAAQTNLILPGDTAWVYADIYEYDIGWIKQGQDAKVTAIAFPGEEFEGVIKSINPVLDPTTRSVKVRIEVQNPDKKLRPEMYVDVVIESMYASPDGSHEVLAVPKEAILDTGTRKLVYVDAGGDQYLGKEVKAGPEAIASVDGKDLRLYPILSGLKEGELVVKKGNFLIDSQSQLSGGMSVLWGGATEIKSEERPNEGGKVETKHRY